MNISDIPSTIERIWNFLIPPLVELTILIGATIFIAGYPSVVNAAKASLPTLAALNDPALIKVLDTYGITQIAPLILLFLLLFVAHAIHKLAYIIGGIVPIHISWNWYAALARIISPSQIAEIWQYYPNVPGVPDLDRIIDEKVESASLEGGKSVFRNAIAHMMRFSKIHSYLSFMKFLLVWGVALSILLLANGFGLGFVLTRLSVFIIVLVVSFILHVKKLQSIIEFYGSAKVTAFITWLHGSVEPRTNPDKEKRRDFEKQAEQSLQVVSTQPTGEFFFVMKSLRAQRKATESHKVQREREPLTKRDAA